MIRLIICLTILTTSSFVCLGQLSEGVTYKRKHDIIIGKSDKYPEESKLADKLFTLTERSIALSDSLVDGMMRSGGQTPFSFLSADPKTETFFNITKDMCSIAIHEIEKGKSRKKINTKLMELTATKQSLDWTASVFKGKSTIESLAEFRELQTACLELTDLVFDEIIDRNKIR